MRALLVPVLVLAVLALPAAPAETEEGSSVGADAYFVSAGVWDVWFFQSYGGATVLDLTWAASLPGADYDLTLWKRGALDDGQLLPHEKLAWSWTYSKATRHERIEVTLEPGEYPVTVEPIQAQGERYRLAADPGHLVATEPGAVGVKL